MDLLKSMIANRQAAGVPPAPPPRPRGSARKGPTKAERAKENAPGSRQMRKFICEEKPGKKIVKEHLEAMMEESSSDEE